jgi:uncharacterized protein YbaR (Trm112 family)
MLNPELLAVLRCPETRQTLHLAEEAQLRELNARVAQGTLHNQAGRAVTRPLDAGLVRADAAICYPIFQGLPILLVEEGIALPPAPAPAAAT